MKKTEDIKQIKLIEKISNSLSNIGDQPIDTILKTEKDNLKILSESMCISPKSMLLFVILFETTFKKGGINASELSKKVGGIYRVAEWFDNIEELIQCGFILKLTHAYRDEINFRLPITIVNKLMEGKNIRPEKISELNNQEFFDRIKKYFKLFENNINGLVVETIERCNNLIELNPNLPISKFILSNGLRQEDILLLLCVIYKHLTDGPIDITTFLKKIENDPNNDILFIIEDEDGEPLDFRQLQRSLMDGENILIKENIIENCKTGDFRNDELYSLTPYGENLFLQDVEIWSNKYKTQDFFSEYYDVIYPENIKEEKLYYNENNRIELDKIEKLLTGDNLLKSFEIGKDYGLKEGIKIILRSEEFGTGKTSWTQQLGRKTGRTVLQVKLSSLKSPYFSESQKNIQELFDEYEKLVGHIMDCCHGPN